MENNLRNPLIQELREKLALCEREKSALAREVLSPSTLPRKRTEALIQRAEVQTRSLDLFRDLEALESHRSR